MATLTELNQENIQAQFEGMYSQFDCNIKEAFLMQLRAFSQKSGPVTV
jgi:hypothetical protein